jgi:hypothetical protein
MCTEEIREREDGVGVVCESVLCVRESICIGFNDTVGRFVFMVLEMWMVVNWKV